MTWDVVRWSLVAVAGAVLLLAALVSGGTPVAYLLGAALLVLGVVLALKARSGSAPRR
jgi:membrane-bound ClpP family serine protease